MAALSTLIAGAPAIAFGHVALDTGSATQAVTGVGFKPNWVMCVGVYDNAAGALQANTGYYDGSAYKNHTKTVYGVTSTTNFYNGTDTTYFYNAYDPSANQVSGTVQSLDSDGFTIAKANRDFTADMFWIAGR